MNKIVLAILFVVVPSAVQAKCEVTLEVNPTADSPVFNIHSDTAGLTVDTGGFPHGLVSVDINHCRDVMVRLHRNGATGDSNSTNSQPLASGWPQWWWSK